MDQAVIVVIIWVVIGYIVAGIAYKIGHNIGSPKYADKGNTKFKFIVLAWPLTLMIIGMDLLAKNSHETVENGKTHRPNRRLGLVSLLILCIAMGGIIWYQKGFVEKEQKDFERILYDFQGNQFEYRLVPRAYTASELAEFLERWPDGHYAEKAKALIEQQKIIEAHKEKSEAQGNLE